MALLLAPYNDSMRLGMGFNSYTQTMCIDKAVTFTQKQVIRAENPSQVVTYSSKCVKRLSDVVQSMNVSYSSSIKKGTVEVAGSSNSINEDKIKESDVNAVVSVKVVNQTTIVDETCEFQALENIMPGTAAFNDAFGDCYISGFIEGGDFNGIISMRVIDRSQIDTVTAKIKQGMSSGGSSDFNMDIDAFSRAGGSTNIAQDTECTISVSWMGGGQIKDPRVAWDMDSVYASAAAFPALVAKCPQKTYAILTKYKANRSFNKWSRQFEFSPLEYDAIASFTAELFDNYMEYKQLTKLIHDMIANPSNYKEQTWKTNRIPLVISTLSAVKKALGIEMRKIVQAVDVLSKDPGALKRGGSFDIEPADGFVQAILAEAQLDVPWQDSGVAAGTQMVQTAAPAQQPFAEQPAEHIGVQQPQAVPAVQESSATGETAVADNANGASNADTAVATTVADGATADAPTAEPTNNTNGAALGCTPPIVVPAPTPLVLNTISMIAPEIWADKLPLLREDVTPAKATDAVSSIPKSLAALLPPPPAFDAEDLKSRAPPVPTLQILSAVCGVNDVTDAVRKLINTADGTLSIRGSAIKGLLDGRTSLPVPDLQDSIHLTAAYQYVGQPIRIFIAKAETSDGSEDTTRTHQITSTSTEYPTVAPLPFDSDIWSITAVVYGAKLMTDSGLFDKIRSTVKTNYDGGKGARWFPINNSFFGSDPWGAHCKTAVVFYSLVEGGVLQSAVGVEGRTPILLTDRRLPDVPDPLAKKFQPPGVTWSGSLVKPTCSRIYFSGWDALKIDGPGRTEPFLSFDNGVGFFFKPDGNFTVEQGGRTLWNGNCGDASRVGQNLCIKWQADNKLCTYDGKGNCTGCWNANGGITDNQSIKGFIVMSSEMPYLEMGWYDGEKRWISTWKS